ncbi:ATP-dependent Clp protease proteolytic subunit [Shouchella clausii]|uniref:ClpP family protease n=1 Tax=Shouchella clausii TaxID=79880 RepID=UPI002DB7919F|nr:ATP-dependent Clp protease proteolytic subunit [Shouchella clausii]MEB5480806.1 ATP-dependent Clp protease proteolytic subunit [Shouchella clausii]
MDDYKVEAFDLYDRIYLENLQDRNIILNEEIDSGLYEKVVMQIKRFNKEDEGKEISDRAPIKIFINSYGGIVYDGFAAVNAIVASKTPIYTYCDGYAMSMGLAIFVAGHKRYAYPFSNFMYHEISGIAIGKTTEVEHQQMENKRLQAMYDSLLLEKTNITKAKLTRVKKNKLDWFFDSKEALEMGLIHQIIS